MAFFFEARRAAARAMALCAGVSVVLGAFGRDVAWLWLGTSLPSEICRWCALVVLAASAWWVSAPRSNVHLERTAHAALLLIAGLAAYDVFACWRAVHSGQLHALSPIPWSAVLSVVCVGLGVTRARPVEHRHWLVRTGFVSGAAAVLLGAQIAGVAFTDYRRPADAIVVLGARVYANGAPSEALAQRMATACELYADGYAPLVIVSGGQGREGPSEPQVMRRLALACGVPDGAIVTDESGVDTQATAADTARIARERSLHSVLAVSHGYHLARVGLALHNEGVRAMTVPARERRKLLGKPYFIARELAAYALYAVGVTPA